MFKNDLFDKVELRIFPVVLDSRKRLLEDGAIPGAWKFRDNQAPITGAVIHCCERA